MRTDIDISQHRVNAAECSGGISSDSIYALIERVLLATGLQGSILDYGAGTGQLTRRLLGLQRFNKVAAADIMTAPADLAPAVEWIKQDLNAPLPEPR